MGAAEHGFTVLGNPAVHQCEHLAAIVHIKLLNGLVEQVHLGILQATLRQLHQILLTNR